jgi:ethanolamine utilization protein EutP (predicted NTPase)
MKRLAPAAEVFEVSALKGDGLDALADWLVRKHNAERA